MKRALIVILILFVTGTVFAENWHKADSKQVGWDAPTILHDGTPLPAGIQGWIFTLYSKDVSGANVVVELQTGAAPVTVTIIEGGKKYIGASAAYVDVDGITSDDSEIAWSDNPVDCENGVTFGIHNLKRPDKPQNMRLP